MNKKDQTIQTYNESADSLFLRYNNIGARIGDIEETFLYTKIGNPTVMELGCGYGREAKEILKRTDDYTGIDISQRFLEIAKENNPTGKFELIDIEEYEFPDNIDIVFAFASLIHTPKEILQKIIKNIYYSLKDRGLFRLSLKYRDHYKEVTNTDEFGTRTYYYYSLDDIDEITEDFQVIKNDIVFTVGQDWIEIILQK